MNTKILCPRKRQVGVAYCNQPQSEYKHSLTLVVYKTINLHSVCYQSNKTRALIANPPNSAQLEGTPLPFPQSYIWVHAVVCECSKGQTDSHTDGRGQYTFRLGLTQNVKTPQDDSLDKLSKHFTIHLDSNHVRRVVI